MHKADKQLQATLWYVALSSKAPEDPTNASVLDQMSTHFMIVDRLSVCTCALRSQCIVGD